MPQPVKTLENFVNRAIDQQCYQVNAWYTDKQLLPKMWKHVDTVTQAITIKKWWSQDIKTWSTETRIQRTNANATADGDTKDELISKRNGDCNSERSDSEGNGDFYS
jgi:hypothetical protein